MTHQEPPPVAQSAMVALPDGRFTMGSDDHYPEESPARLISLPGFQIDVATVTNAEFAQFVAATGYVTTSERPSSSDGKSDHAPEPGSVVFFPTTLPVPLTDHRRWWRFVPGASWRHPEGPGSSIANRQTHPVVHVSYHDATAYADWAGKSLPSEAQWEYAALASEQTLPPAARAINIWRGAFPYLNERSMTHPYTVPAAGFQPRANGIYNMLGNVWEWTSDPFDRSDAAKTACCGTGGIDAPEQQRTLKGGSYLCAETYCRRYRPAARIGMPQAEATGHIGFRCVQADPRS